MSSKPMIVVVATAVAMIGLGFAGSTSAQAPAAGAAATATATSPASPYVNERCPIMTGSKIDPAKVTPELTREYKGVKVAFCCAGCLEAWDKLSDKEKDAKLAAVLKPGTTMPAK